MTDTTTTADTAAPALPAFLDGFARMHDAMRRDADRLPLAVAAAEGPDAMRGLLRWFRSFRATLEHHHEREDDILWPELVRRDPSFAAPQAELLADHHVLDAALAGTESALAGDGDAAAWARQLADVLVEHLAREEAAAFPRLAVQFDAEEYEEVERSFIKGTTLGQLAFEIPWVLDGLDGEQVADMEARAPRVLRIAHRLVFAPRYARIAAPVLAVGR